MPARRIGGRIYEEIAVTATADKPLPVEIGSATLSVTADGVEIRNDVGNPIPINDAGGSLTIDSTALTSIDGKIPALVGGRLPVDVAAISVGDVEIKNDAGNPIPTSVVARTPTTASVASSATSVTVLAASATRKGISFSNISTAKLYLSFTSPATVANCFIEVPPGAFLLLDQQLVVSSAVYGIWDSANGAVQVTEYS